MSATCELYPYMLKVRKKNRSTCETIAYPSFEDFLTDFTAIQSDHEIEIISFGYNVPEIDLGGPMSVSIQYKPPDLYYEHMRRTE